ncbi:MAG: hypothetical protein MHM6MM_004979 [Cercozoa sp. M6MM]
MRESDSDDAKQLERENVDEAGEMRANRENGDHAERRLQREAAERWERHWLRLKALIWQKTMHEASKKLYKSTDDEAKPREARESMREKCIRAAAAIQMGLTNSTTEFFEMFGVVSPQSVFRKKYAASARATRFDEYAA